VDRENLLEGFRVMPPTFRTMLFLPLFFVASGIQYDCHAYLSSLPKYTLPSHPIFNSIICPHYTMECLIYFSMMFLAAPQGEWINKTILTILIFVVVNLGHTAEATRAWSAQKFGSDKIALRWRMIPLIW
jgi:3-oxo-5-alpha-steroid 4-dehydrogenase 3